MVEEDAEQAVVFLHQQLALLRLVGALDHHPGAMADELAEARRVGQRRAASAQRVVEALEQVGSGVDERAVEVENDGRLAHESRSRMQIPAPVLPGADGG